MENVDIVKDSWHRETNQRLDELIAESEQFDLVGRITDRTKRRMRRSGNNLRKRLKSKKKQL